MTVGEDPRFGHEYFLRAESLEVRLRWQSLFLGRVELGMLSLKRPSLNLVQNSEGDWNLAEWLPRPSASGGDAPANQRILRLRRIEVESGRINFKRGDEKLPFAFVGVSGYVESKGAGRWQLELEATPSRAAVILQQAGTLRLVGDLGGTSSRLRPAVLTLAWQGAAIPDVLRIARGYDYGLRGNLAAALDARTSGDTWMLQGSAGLRQLHRWDLVARIDNPSLNLSLIGRLDFARSRIELTDAVLEMPHSSAHARGAMEWNPVHASSGESSGTRIEVGTASVDLGDALSWLRAFHPGVSDDLSLRGSAGLGLTLQGWPPRVGDAKIVIHGAELSGAALPMPVRLSSTEMRIHEDGIRLAPATIRFGVPGGKSGGFILAEELLEAVHKERSNLRVAGTVSEIRDWLATASALGWNPSRGWDAGGPASFEFVWLGGTHPWLGQPRGRMEWGDATVGGSLRAPFLNQSIDHIRAVVTLRRNARDIALSSAEAFGARWRGSIDRGEPPLGWQFSLSADHIAATDLDRWLNPRWQQGFLSRVLPFLSARAPANLTPDSIQANGHIRIDQFALAPLMVRRLDGELKVDGRHIALTNAKADFYGGSVAGTLQAELGKEPGYRVGLDFARVDLGALVAAAPKLANLFSGAASGKISFQARGAARADLLASLSCEGSGRVDQAQVRSINMTQLLPKLGDRARAAVFPEVSASFTCSNGMVQFQELQFTGPDADIAGSGSVDFAGNVDFRLQPAGGSGVARAASVGSPQAAAFDLRGPLLAPTLTRAATVSPRPR